MQFSPVADVVTLFDPVFVHPSLASSRRQVSGTSWRKRLKGFESLVSGIQQGSRVSHILPYSCSLAFQRATYRNELDHTPIPRPSIWPKRCQCIFQSHSSGLCTVYFHMRLSRLIACWLFHVFFPSPSYAQAVSPDANRSSHAIVDVQEEPQAIR